MGASKSSEDEKKAAIDKRLDNPDFRKKVFEVFD